MLNIATMTVQCILDLTKNHHPIKFNISFLLDNSYANLSLSINASNNVIFTHNFLLEELARESTFGKTITVTTLNDVTAGIHYVNIEYRVKENLLSNVAIPINILAEPNITIEMQVQEHIYTNAEFPFTVSIQSDNIVLNNVTIRIIPPKEIEFRGNTVYTISHIDVIKPVEFKSMLVTPSETELDHEHHIPFQVTVEYVDHDGMLNSKSEVVMVLLRQKNIFEFNSGWWFLVRSNITLHRLLVMVRYSAYWVRHCGHIEKLEKKE